MADLLLITALVIIALLLEWDHRCKRMAYRRAVFSAIIKRND